jgi:hypothetical protein
MDARDAEFLALYDRIEAEHLDAGSKFMAHLVAVFATSGDALPGVSMSVTVDWDVLLPALAAGVGGTRLKL